MNVLNESTNGARRSWRRRAMAGAGLAATALIFAACVPEPTTPPATTTTTTTTTAAPTTTTTEATTTTTTAPVVWNPQVVVSKTSGINPDGDTLTVTGSGFDPDANVGTRPPLSGQKSGVYITFGKYADVWQPSAGAASSTRQTITQVWALPQASYDALGGIPGTVVLNADGTFSATLAVAPSATGTNAYGVAVYPGSGAVNPAQEILTRTTFAPKVTVSKSTDLVAGETVTVEGIGFLPSANGTRPPLSGQPSGVYVTFGKFGDPWKPSAGAPSSSRKIITQVWALPQASYTALGGIAGTIAINPDGSFSADVAIATESTSSNPYGFAVYPGSGAVDAAQEFLIPASFAPDPA